MNTLLSFSKRIFRFFSGRISKLFDRVIYSRRLLLLVTLVLSGLICGSLYFEEISLKFLDGEVISQTFNNIPVQVQINTELYEVQGMPDTVSATLEGPAAQLQVLRNQNSLIVIADLQDYGEGLNEIDLRLSNVPAGVEVVSEPETVTIDIERKTKKSFLVSPELLLGTGQSPDEFETPVLAYNRVVVTGTRSQINSIRTVKAIVDASGQDGDFTAQAIVVAYDSSGKQISSVELDPETIDATIMRRSEPEEDLNGE